MAARGFSHESSKGTLPNDEFNEWYTPKYIFDAIGIEFDMDPCSPGEGHTFVPAKKHLTIVDDGLVTPWEGTVFVNPPYGKYTPVWMKKLAEHGDGIGLVFARTDVKWFHEYGVKADAICFIQSRVKFYQGGIADDKQGGTPGAGSMLLGYGQKAKEALLGSGLGATFSYLG
jgi:hypothetical protein